MNRFLLRCRIRAIARLEGELGVNLFERVGRNIRITDNGLHLQKRASQLLNLEELTRSEISDGRDRVVVKIYGEVLLLSEYAPPLVKHIQKHQSNCRFDLRGDSSHRAFERLEYGEAHLALTTEPPPKHLCSKVIDKVSFKTCVGKGHPLYRSAQKEEPVHVDQVLAYPFAFPDVSMLGKTRARQSIDGWRDDRFPRQISYQVSDPMTYQSIVERGMAIAYLPSYFAQRIKVEALHVTGCPYSCEQSVYLACRDPKELGWLNRIW